MTHSLVTITRSKKKSARNLLEANLVASKLITKIRKFLFNHNYTVKTENGYQAALRPRLPPRAAPRLVHQDLWPIRTNVGGFFFGFEVGIPDL